MMTLFLGGGEGSHETKKKMTLDDFCFFYVKTERKNKVKR